LCKALASFLFSDEQRGLWVFETQHEQELTMHRVTINMSEYHDRYTVSRLIGAAPGLVGYDEGGKPTFDK
jgi:ATP-dependent Clp protease ATP-binding subunit ClpB